MTEEKKYFRDLELDPKVKAQNKRYFQIGAGVLFLLVILNSLFGYWLLVGIASIGIIYAYWQWKNPSFKSTSKSDNLSKYKHTKTYKLSKDDLKEGFGFNEHTITNLRVDKKTKDVLVEVKENEN